MSLREAIEQAIATAKTQRACVPHLPTGWFARADVALRHDHPLAMTLVAVELVDAHAGYPASWDRWPWLDALRQATSAAREERRTDRGPDAWARYSPHGTGPDKGQGQASAT